MNWKAKVDLFEQLRREHEFGIGTIADVAVKFGVHRRVVRRAFAVLGLGMGAAFAQGLPDGTAPPVYGSQAFANAADGN